MTEPQNPISTTHDGNAAQADGGPKPPATPRWVKVTGAAITLVVVALLIKVLFGGGVSHGPGLHGALGTTTPAPAAAAPDTALALPGL